MGESWSTFVVTLHPTYFNTGFFNVPIEADGNLTPTHGTEIAIDGIHDLSVVARVNRTANTNETARVMGGIVLRDWFQKHFQEYDRLLFSIVGPTKLAVRAAGELS